jgi:hypothetical protein
MEISAHSLARLAAERRFQPATLERVVRLLDVLHVFSADGPIASRVALKGGTALNVFHAALERLSVDIDLNYVGEADQDRMQADRSVLEDRLLRLLEAKGYSARRTASIEHAGGKWVFRYASVLGGSGSIEIDINYLYRTPLFGVSRMSSFHLGIPGSGAIACSPLNSVPVGGELAWQAHSVPVLDLHEIIGGKLVALITRRAARDLFDTYRIIAMPGLNWSKIRLATLMIGAAARKFDWRTASVERIGCDGKDLAAKLIACLPARYFDPYGGQKG